MATTDFRQRIGSLHNGISTQSASSRFPSQVEDAENALFSVVSGVSTRAGSRHFAQTVAGVNTQYYRAHRIVRDATERYMVIYGRDSSNTILRIVDLANPRNRTQYVTGPGSGTFTLTFGGQTTSALNFNASAATVQTALEGLTTVGAGRVTVSRSGTGPYVFTCVFDDSVMTQTVMTASAGSVVGNIITPTFNSTTQTYLNTNSPTADDLRLLTIVDTTIIVNTKAPTDTGKRTFSATATRSSGSTTATITTTTPHGLAANNSINTLTASWIDTATGTYSVASVPTTTTFTITTTATTALTAAAGSFEWANTHTAIDETKFPVKLVRSSLAPPTFTVSFVTQATELKAANTNATSWQAPSPFQADTVISDIAYHRGRLCLAMGEFVVCSQPNDLFNFFPYSSSTFASNPADPITVQIGSNTISLIDYMVPFRKSLLLLTRAGTQFELGGDETFTASNATFTPSTTYNTQKVRPVPVSSMIYLAGAREESSLIYEYVYDDIQVSNRANTITQHVDGLLPTSLRSLIGSDNNDTLVVVPQPTTTDPTSTITSNGVGGGFFSNPSTWVGNKCPTPTNTTIIATGDIVIFDGYGNTDGSLYVYRSTRVADKLVQSAWTRYSFGGDIINDAIVIDDTLYILRTTLISSNLNMIVESMPLTSDPLAPASFSEQPRLDHRHVIKGGTYNGSETSWTLPYADPSINTVVWMDNGVWKQRFISMSGTTATSTPIPNSITGTDLTGKLVVLGRAIPFRVTFTRLYQQDGSGNPIIEGELEVSKVVTDHFRSGPYKVSANSLNRQTRTSTFTPPTTSDFDAQGRFTAWCVGRSNDLTVTVENIDARPTILTGIEYYGRHTSMLHGGNT